MLLSLFQLCTLANTLPLVLSLVILLPNDRPLQRQSTQISLRWILGDPQEFNLGVYWAKGDTSEVLPDYSLVPVYQAMKNFTQDQNVTMVFNNTVGDDVRDHILMAWGVGHNPLTYSGWFAVNGSTTTDTEIGGTIMSSSTDSSALVSQSPVSTATNEHPTATVAVTNNASRTGAIAGGLLGSLALLSISGLMLFMLRRRRRSRSTVPFRDPRRHLNENRGALTPFPLKSSYMSSHQEPETEAQEPVPELPAGRDYIQAEIARIREEILVLRLENQTRHVEFGHESFPPPSYRSTLIYPFSNV